MRKTKLSKKDSDICSRLRQVRELLGYTQDEFARQIGLERATLSNYEQQRTPLRFEVALRFCRQFIISEEWLATGDYTACRAEAARRDMKPDPELDEKIFRWQCMDLLSEPLTLHIAPGTLFSEAYAKFLAPQYAQLVRQSFYFPRIYLTDSDKPELAVNFLTAINKRFVLLLQNEAHRRKLVSAAGWRRYTRHVFFASDVIFKRMMALPLSAKEMESEDMNWLRYISTDQAATIPFIENPEGVANREGRSIAPVGSALTPAQRAKAAEIKKGIDTLENDLRRILSPESVSK